MCCIKIRQLSRLPLLTKLCATNVHLRRHHQEEPHHGQHDLYEAGYQHSSQLNLAARVKMTVLTWLERSRSRRQLSELPEYLLKDIGLNESDRYQETTKPFWRG